MIDMNSSGDISNAVLSDKLFLVPACGSVLICLVAAILVLALRLYKRVVYRLALYQVLASLAFAIVEVLQSILVSDYHSSESCAAIGWLTVYTQWMKLLFTVWVTLHIFCFGVFHKTLRLEVLYVVTSLLVPAVIASVPLTTNTYGRVRLSDKASFCYIFGNETDNTAAVIERLVLWDGPAMIILFAASTAMAAMVLKLTHKVGWRMKYDSLAEGDQFWKALKQLLPLAAFPILFFIFIMPQLAMDIYLATTPTANKVLFLVAIAFISLWSLTSGVTLIVHICIAKRCSKGRQRNDSEHISLNTQDH